MKDLQRVKEGFVYQSACLETEIDFNSDYEKIIDQFAVVNDKIISTSLLLDLLKMLVEELKNVEQSNAR